MSGATGIVTQSLKKNLQGIPGTHSIDFLQKTAILGTSHVLRKALQCETWNLSDGVHRWFKKHTGKKGPVTSDTIIIIIIIIIIIREFKPRCSLVDSSPSYTGRCRLKCVLQVGYLDWWFSWIFFSFWQFSCRDCTTITRKKTSPENLFKFIIYDSPPRSRLSSVWYWRHWITNRRSSVGSDFIVHVLSGLKC